jgi:uncharacterized protein YbcI
VTDVAGHERARRIAWVVSAFERERTGHPAAAVTVSLAAATLAVTLHGALSPAELALTVTREGVALVREFHRTLFAGVCAPLCAEIARLIGVDVRESSAEVQGATGTMVLVFLLAAAVPADNWSGPPPSD